MSKCIDCGSNFVTDRESTADEGKRCRSCDNKRLRAELEAAKAEIEQLRIDRAQSRNHALDLEQKWNEAKAREARLASALESAKAEIYDARAELALTIDDDKKPIVAGIQRLSALLHGLAAAIETEPELPGPMPDEMWEAIRNDRELYTKALQIAIKQTKENILKRGDSTALRDLLGPFLECFEETRTACAAFASVLALNNLADAGILEAEKRGVKKEFGTRGAEELARLRAVMGEKA